MLENRVSNKNVATFGQSPFWRSTFFSRESAYIYRAIGLSFTRTTKCNLGYFKLNLASSSHTSSRSAFWFELARVVYCHFCYVYRNIINTEIEQGLKFTFNLNRLDAFISLTWTISASAKFLRAKIIIPNLNFIFRMEKRKKLILCQQRNARSHTVNGTCGGVS
jgi:hypothetical protein